MFALAHWIFGLAAVYGVIGVVVFRLARKPSCRTCLNRSNCPNRLDGLSKINHVPKCIASKRIGETSAL